MAKSILIKNASIVNENKTFLGDVLIENEIIKKISSEIKATENFEVIDAEGKLLIPGFIDDQVHFREPGLTHKATIATESRAAVAGGITTFIEMPNTVPQATTQDLLEDKFTIASKDSYANYSFMFGGTNDNLDELLKTDPKKVAGIKLFLGSSTGNMLVDNEQVLEKIFSSTKMIISVHCEDEATIKKNTQEFINKYGEDIPLKYHPIIRSEEACYLSSSKAIELAKKTGARLHIFHVSTAKETELFRNDIPLEEKQITAEVCIHHLWFSDKDYAEKGTHIKWNPAVKTETDRQGLWKALLDDRIDVLATDHAPHTLEEKNNVYTKAPSGGPLVQHAIPAILEKVKEGVISIEKAVEKMSHNPAKLFQIEKRGFIKEGYFADLVLIDTNKPQNVSKDTILYKCGWSPFEGTTFSSTITHTFVNGNLMYNQGVFNDKIKGKRITFNR
ncbi:MULTISPECIES: dihydroorotase [unclassified Polaribacter]|jgi:dihydroorotase|uniref:dihydroorotase n=1 Tax=unclassified Polaribacter TaxID=196858 RepID=UPI00052DA640|nr:MULTISPECIES: dihydroorotase [unclassified Polaribacter]KGL60208.1 dihydroorotase [Polaribacter sp. Hel1_33_49]MBT3742526.1 dihydroorotase [Polaribacter sp.]MBT4412865.1 dihydroorotase [Polaribacter sp.]MDG1195419.1 dihydroorotase [Polaribacter sp.]MDG1404241.1 dihydroorotase [Polaribacter sp.]